MKLDSRSDPLRSRDSNPRDHFASTLSTAPGEVRSDRVIKCHHASTVASHLYLVSISATFTFPEDKEDFVGLYFREQDTHRSSLFDFLLFFRFIKTTTQQCLNCKLYETWCKNDKIQQQHMNRYTERYQRGSACQFPVESC